ncbi:MAG TPA: hypothetical protein VGO93_13705 [Candidatus Xenobia bacterium]|jgi:hypothetical protein
MQSLTSATQSQTHAKTAAHTPASSTLPGERATLGEHGPGCPDCATPVAPKKHPAGCACCTPAKPKADKHPAGCACCTPAQPKADKHPAGCPCCTPAAPASSTGHPAGCGCCSGNIR